MDAESKPFTVMATWQGDVLMVELTGKVASKQIADEIAAEVFRLVGAQAPQRMLIDCRGLAGRLRVGDTYFHVKDYPSQPVPQPRVAVVDSPAHREHNSFHESAAANAGFGMVYFYSVPEALAWLRRVC